jgi:alanine adding enzyme
MFSGMLESFREFSAPFLIQEYMLRLASKRRIARYNFMGINAQDNPEQGVLKFKQNFKGVITQSSGNYELVLKPWIYRLSELLKKVLGRN